MDETSVAESLAELGRKMDTLGQQMNWLCENLSSLFGFVNQMSQNGGGIRGMMHALRQGPPPELNTDMSLDTESKVAG